MCLAIPGQVVEIADEERRLAKVDVAGVRRTVNIGLLDSDPGPTHTDGASPSGVQPGEWVLIHVGFAMSRIDEAEAQATLRLLEELGEEYEQELEDFRSTEVR